MHIKRKMCMCIFLYMLVRIMYSTFVHAHIHTM
jgi:hypothetical protein